MEGKWLNNDKRKYACEVPSVTKNITSEKSTYIIQLTPHSTALQLWQEAPIPEL
jgi:hypothetical protein